MRYKPLWRTFEPNSVYGIVVPGNTWMDQRTVFQGALERSDSWQHSTQLGSDPHRFARGSVFLQLRMQLHRRHPILGSNLRQVTTRRGFSAVVVGKLKVAYLPEEHYQLVGSPFQGFNIAGLKSAPNATRSEQMYSFANPRFCMIFSQNAEKQ